MFVKTKQIMCQKGPLNTNVHTVSVVVLRIKWLQTNYSVKRTFTRKQIPKQYAKLNLLSAIKVSI